MTKQSWWQKQREEIEDDEYSTLEEEKMFIKCEAQAKKERYEMYLEFKEFLRDYVQHNTLSKYILTNFLDFINKKNGDGKE